MELDEFQILQRQAGAQHHAATVAGAAMGRGGREIGAAIATGRQHDGMAAEAVDAAIFHADGDDAAAFLAVRAIFHDQVDGEIFDVEVGVILQALLIESVQHGVAGAVGGGASALHRRAGAHILHVAAERTLIDGAVLVAAERHAGMFQLDHRRRRFAHHIFDRVLVAQPVRPLDGVVHVPGPVIGAVVAERGGDAALRRHGVAAGREQLGDAGGLETRFGAAHGGAQARAAGTHDDGVVGMVDDLVSFAHYLTTPMKAILAIAKTPAAAPA